MARPLTCADCDGPLGPVVCRSFFFLRPLCPACYRAERDRPRADAERWVLERMFARPSAISQGDPR